MDLLLFENKLPQPNWISCFEVLDLRIDLQQKMRAIIKLPALLKQILFKDLLDYKAFIEIDCLYKVVTGIKQSNVNFQVVVLSKQL